MVLNYQFVGSYTDVKWILSAPALTFKLPLLLAAEVGEDFQAGAPPLKFHLPVNDDCCWHHDQVGSPNASVTRQASQQADCLNCFSETHLVG